MRLWKLNTEYSVGHWREFRAWYGPVRVLWLGWRKGAGEAVIGNASNGVSVILRW